MTLQDAEERIKKLEAENKRIREILDNIEKRIDRHAEQATRNFEKMDERVKSVEGQAPQKTS